MTTPSDFKAQLRTDGYNDIERQTLQPRPGAGGHRHTFAIRGLVIEGQFNVAQGDNAETFSPGQVFSVERGMFHN